MALNAGVAYVDVLPNMGKFAPAVAAQAKSSSGVLTKLGKTGALAVAAIGVGSVVMAADFEKAMRNVNSLAQLPEPAFKRLNDEVLDLAGKTAQAPKTLAEGLYDLVSSGFDAQESLKILASSAEAATAGLTTTEVSTAAVAAVLNAYRLPASRADEVSDQLFKTVEQGVIRFDELASNIGDTLPFAASLGVGLDELGASTATMTKQGLGASETFTRIRNLIQTLIKPNEELQGAFEELGVSSGEALIKQRGFQGALEAIVGTTDGTKAAVAELFPNIRALGGALALTGKNAEEARADLKGMQDASGATSRVFEEQAKSFALQWQQLKANLTVLAIRIGNVLLPPLTEAVRFLNEDLGPAIDSIGQKVAPVFQDLKGIGQGIVSAFSSAIGWVRRAGTNVANFAKSFIPVKIAVAAVKVAIRELGPVIAFVRGMARILGSVISGAFRVAKVAVGQVIGAVKSFGAVIGNIVGVASNLLRGNLAGAWRNLKEVVSSVMSGIKGVVQSTFEGLKAVFNSVKEVGVAAFNAVKGVIGDLVGAVQDAIGAVSDLIGKLGSALGLGGDLKDSWDAAAAAANNAIAAGNKVGRSAVAPRAGDRPAFPRLIPLGPAVRLAPAADLAGAGRFEFTITNWRDGVGFFRRIAGDETEKGRRFERQRERMRPQGHVAR